MKISHFNKFTFLILIFSFLLISPPKSLAVSTTVSLVTGCTTTSGTNSSGVSCSSMTMITFSDAINTLQERKDVQKVLNKVLSPSPNLTVDGVFGSKTIAAIKTLQTKYKLTADGVVGPATRAALQQAQTDYYNLRCSNGATNYPTCTTLPYSTCSNGAANYPLCTTNSSGACLNGATNPPTCMVGTCSNGATNYPNCTIFAADTTAPTITGFSIPSTSTSLTISITNLTATDNVAVTGYLLTETSTKPSATLTTWAMQTPSYTFSSAGTKTLYAWAKDAAGNVSSYASASTTITLTTADTTKPSIYDFVIPSTSTSLTVPVTAFVATDNVGVTGYALTESTTTPTSWSATAPTSYTFSSAGSKTLYAWARQFRQRRHDAARLP